MSPAGGSYGWKFLRRAARPVATAFTPTSGPPNSSPSNAHAPINEAPGIPTRGKGDPLESRRKKSFVECAGINQGHHHSGDTGAGRKERTCLTADLADR